MHLKLEPAPGAALFGAEDGAIDRAIDAPRFNRYSVYNHPGFAPVRQEHRHVPVRISGRLPADLRGVYLRNGTNVQFDHVHTRAHCFNGAGMLHQVQIGEGAASYSNTYIRTPRFEYERLAGREVFPSFADMSSSGEAGLQRMRLLAKKQAAGVAPRWSALEANPASTSVQYHHGKLYCLQGSGLPFVLDASFEKGRLVLDGCGQLQDWDGALRVPFSAHPRIDPVSGDFYNVSVDNRGRSIWMAQVHAGALVNCLKVDDAPTGESLPGTIHDYFLTENFIVVPDVSLRFSEDNLQSTRTSFWRFDATRPLRWGVLPRNAKAGDRIRWISTARPGMVWHVVNAWEESGPDGRPRIVLYAPVFDDYPANVPIHTPEEPHARLTKWVLDAEGGTLLEEKRLLEHGYERPSLNLSFVGRRNRYAYLLDEAVDGYMGKGVLKYDLLAEREVAYFSYGEFHGGEALFVPREGSTGEDDGYLVDLLMAGERAELLVLDAATLAEVCRLHLPARVPFGVHACWLDAAKLTAMARPGP
jgi:carotenoid cleavage dioxygenase-like enzyme